MKLDKTKWKKTKLIDVVTKKEENDKLNAKNRFQKFLKVEHFDAESLNIKRWGNQENDELPPTFFKIFRKGQVLFPTRNPHLRRTALASFDGICGEKTLTLEPNSEIVQPDFIPFLFHSESFYNHTISAIVGSTNPHVRWRDVANYEFLLPPKDQQARLAELLWGMDEVIEKALEFLEHSILLRNINREKLYTYGIEALKKKKITNTKNGKSGLIRIDFNESKFFDCVEIKSGQVDPQKKKYANLYQIGSERIESNTGKITELKTAKELNIKSGNYLFTEDDIIYSKIRPYFKKVALPKFRGLCSADIYPLRLKKGGILKEYLFYYLLTEKFTRKLLRFQNRTGMPKVNRDELKAMYIPFPDYEEQKKIVKILKEIDGYINSNQNKISSSKSLQKSLISQVF
ncbi:restriction endonuclease subunit S [Desulfobacterales bacterium HSG17]|nr:restriction endonuclease subunit S [Desulfobacterales bacterium HSG17]